MSSDELRRQHQDGGGGRDSTSGTPGPDSDRSQSPGGDMDGPGGDMDGPGGDMDGPGGDMDGPGGDMDGSGTG